MQYELEKIEKESLKHRLDVEFAFKFEDNLSAVNEMLFKCI